MPCSPTGPRSPDPRRLRRCRRSSSIAQVCASLAAGALVVIACSTGGEGAIPAPTSTPAPSAVPSDPEPTPTPAAPTPTPSGRAERPDEGPVQPGSRIAVMDSDGQIFTMLGDGTDLIDLTAPEPGRANRFPTWSADAARLAWVNSDAEGSDGRIRTARYDGTAWLDQAVGTAPFYLAWDPTGRRIAALSNGSGGLELTVADTADPPLVERIDSGAPYWFSWGPDGDVFLVHASGLRLDLVDVDGSTTVLEPNPASFGVPVWLDGPVPLVYAVRSDDGADELVVAGNLGSGSRPILAYDGYLRYVVAPSSGLIALEVLDADVSPIPEIVTASTTLDGSPTLAQFDEPPEDVVDVIPRDQLVVMATFGGEPIVLSPDPFGRFDDAPVVGFWWAPDGEQLAWLVELDPGTGCDTETARYEWRYYTGNALAQGPRFTATPTFACDYLPYFDQFAQSVSFWSPDSTEVVYAGIDEQTGRRGVFSHQVGSVVPPRYLADGEIGVWSPDAAGGAASAA